MKKKILVLIVLGAFFALAAIIVTFIAPQKCYDIECFQEYTVGCRKAIYVNEAPDATWKYEINGKDGKKCSVNVLLLQPKSASTEIERLKGMSMVCLIEQGLAEYPEKDLSKCHGRLKEEIQTITINNLYKYIIENLGSIDESLNSLI